MWSEFEREYDEYRTHSRDEKRDAVFNAMVAQQTVANAAPSPSYATSPWMAHNYLYRRLPAEPWYPEDNNKQKPAVPNFLKQQSIPAVSKPMSPSLTNHVSKEPVQHLDPVSLSTAPIGMMNAGASMCFVNTVLQCLAHIPGLPQELAGGRQPPPGSQGAVFINMVTSLMLELNCHAPTTGIYRGWEGDLSLWYPHGLVQDTSISSAMDTQLNLSIDRLMQERHKSIALAMELCLSWTNPSIYVV